MRLRGASPRERRPRRRRARLGVLLIVLGSLVGLFAYGGWATGYVPCETDPADSGWLPVTSRGNAVAVTSPVLEFESGTGGLFCEQERTLRVRARARPAGGKPIFLGVGSATATRRYLATSRYDLAATWMALLETRSVGSSAGRLEPPGDQPFWRTFSRSSVGTAGSDTATEHRWRAVGSEPFAGPRSATPLADRFWLVLMNADGSPGIAADLRYEVGLAPRARWPWLVVGIASLTLLAAGVTIAFRRTEPLDRITPARDREVAARPTGRRPVPERGREAPLEPLGCGRPVARAPTPNRIR